MAKLNFSLVSPAQELFSGEVDHVIAPGSEGEFGVLVNHAPFMTTLTNGVVKILDDSAPEMRIFVRGGFADVTPAGLTILAEDAINLESVDAASIGKEVETLSVELGAAHSDEARRAYLEDEIAFRKALQDAL